MKLIVGLGNPGAEYKGTRHNAGFAVVDLLASHLEATWKNDAKRFAQVATATVNGDTMILIKPETFMNESGRAVRATMSQRKIKPEDTLIIHDDMDLPVGRLKFTVGGGAGGHNGVADIQERLGADNVARVKIGIGRPTGRTLPEKWVLGKPRGKEREEIEITIEKACDAALDWMTLGIAKAMNKWN